MAFSTEGLTKRVAIDNANLQVLITVGLGSFITIFCLIAAFYIKNDNAYRSRVITGEKTTEAQASANLTAYAALQQSYHKFLNGPDIVTGQPSSTNTKDPNDNSVIVLDALPDKYDFPGLASTLDKILINGGFSNSQIGGTDLGSSSSGSGSSSSSTPIAIPFNITIMNTNYQGLNTLLQLLQNSIRPIDVQTLTVSGSNNDLTVNVTAQSYYQPDTTLNITNETIK